MGGGEIPVPFDIRGKEKVIHLKYTVKCIDVGKYVP